MISKNQAMKVVRDVYGTWAEDFIKSHALDPKRSGTFAVIKEIENRLYQLEDSDEVRS